jgi:hypothetical protein
MAPDKPQNTENISTGLAGSSQPTKTDDANVDDPPSTSTAGSSKPFKTDDVNANEPPPSTSAAGPSQPINTDISNDDEPPQLETPDGLTSEERLMKTLHELRSTVARLEAEAKSRSAPGPSDLGDVTVKQEPVDAVLEHKDSPSKCMFINRKKKLINAALIEPLDKPEIVELSDTDDDGFVNIGACCFNSYRFIFTTLIELKGAMKRKGKGKAGGLQKKRKVIKG